MGTLLLFLLLWRRRSRLYARSLLFPAFMLLTLFFWYAVGINRSGGVPATLLVLAVQAFALSSLRGREQADLLYKIICVFAVVSFAGLLFFLIRFLGIDFPHLEVLPTNSLKLAYGSFYEISFLGGLLNTNGSIGYCGLYDETGYLGTMLGLLFVAADSVKALYRYPKMRLYKAAILVEGIATFSLAFFAILLVYVMCRCLSSHSRRFALLLGGLLIFACIVPHIPIENLTFSRLQERIQDFLLNPGAVLSQRMSVAAQGELDTFFGSDNPLVLFFGFGPSALESWASRMGTDMFSILAFIYDYGFVGIGAYFAMILSAPLSKPDPCRFNWCFILPFIASTYQRPDIFSALAIALIVLSSGIQYREKGEERYADD